MGAVDPFKELSKEQKAQVEKLLTKKRQNANGPTEAEVSAAIAKVKGAKAEKADAKTDAKPEGK